jgi:4-amino-4-deoxy-L-arabinose transferase-like glycosyltransferase
MSESYKRKCLLLLLIATLVRGVFAAFTGLGNDEVYYYTYALTPQWSYFDHPPMVGWCIRLFTANLHWDAEIFVRLAAILGAAVNTWLIYQIAVLLASPRAGFMAALLYTASLYTSIISGVFILPDSPQVVFWMLALWLALLVFYKTRNKTQQRKLLLWLGVVIGLCIMSKVHGVFLWAGIGLYILLYDRKWLSNPWLYLSLLLTLLVMAPMIYWNIDTHFITYNYHSERVSLFEGGLHMDNFFKEWGGGVLYSNPLCYALYVLMLAAVWRGRLFLPVKPLRLLLCCSLPLIAVFLFISLFRSTLPHWSGPGFMGLMLLTACWLHQRYPVRIPLVLWLANGLICVLLVVGFWMIKAAPVSLGKKDKQLLGDGDVTLDMEGWKNFKDSFALLYEKDMTTGGMQKGAGLVSNKWFPAAHLLYYVGRPLQLPLHGIGTLEEIHHFAWLNDQIPALKPGTDAYYITPSNYFTDPAHGISTYFTTTDPPQRIAQRRGGMTVRYFYIYRLHHYRGN